MLTATAVSVSWVQFNSNLYPYTVKIPSSFRHVVLKDISDRNGDYFFPSLGSQTTNVHIDAEPGRDHTAQAAHLRSLGGHNIRVVGSIHVAGQSVVLMHADFRGLIGRWSVDQACFTTHDTSWTLTASYARKYRQLRSTLLRILQSFRLRQVTALRRR